MDRRTALKHLAIFGGGILLAPSCQFSKKSASIALDNLNINSDQENMLADITETFIPATDIPGAKDMKLHHFVLTMVDDCRGPSDQKTFQEGLGMMNDLADQKYGRSFSECSVDQKDQLLSSILEDKSSKAQPFLNMTRRYTIEGFLQSKYVLSEIEHYKLVPGHFDGCVAV